MYCIINLKLKHFYANTFHTVEIEDEEIFFIIVGNGMVYPGDLIPENQGVERTESTPQTETTTEMGPQPSASSNPPSIPTRESIIFYIPASARAQLSEGDIQPDPGLRKPIESLDPDLRDVARRMYINMGPCQPTDQKYRKTKSGNSSKE